MLRQGIPLEFPDRQPPAENRPFDSALDLACRNTLLYYIEIGAIVRIPDSKVRGLWSTFFPVPKTR